MKTNSQEEPTVNRSNQCTGLTKASDEAFVQYPKNTKPSTTTLARCGLLLNNAPYSNRLSMNKGHKVWGIGFWVSDLGLEDDPGIPPIVIFALALMVCMLLNTSPHQRDLRTNFKASV